SIACRRCCSVAHQLRSGAPYSEACCCWDARCNHELASAIEASDTKHEMEVDKMATSIVDRRRRLPGVVWGCNGTNPAFHPFGRWTGRSGLATPCLPTSGGPALRGRASLRVGAAGSSAHEP